MSESSAVKICGVCGQDCSGKPRTKDKNGKYFCKSCYDDTMLRRQPGSAPSIAAKPHPASVPDEDNPYHMLGAIIDAQPAMAAPPTAVHSCPVCGANLPLTATLCVNCGFNVITGNAIAAPKIMPAAKSGRTTAWPIVIGVIALAFGGFGTVVYLVQLVDILGSSNPNAGPGYSVVQIAVTMLAFSLSLWQAVAGLGVLRRTQSGFAMLRRWAIWCTVLGCIMLTCMGVGLAVVLGSASSSSPAVNSAQVGVLVVAIIMVAVIALAWPIFVVIWTGRDAIKREVQHWN